MTTPLPRRATVDVDGEAITGTVYHVRDNGWPCVETDTGRCASGPKVDDPNPFYPFAERFISLITR